MKEDFLKQLGSLSLSQRVMARTPGKDEGGCNTWKDVHTYTCAINSADCLGPLLCCLCVSVLCVYTVVLAHVCVLSCVMLLHHAS